MVQNFKEFEKDNTEIKVNDRVICHGSVERKGYNGSVKIDLDGQTGIVTGIMRLSKFLFYDVFLDNFTSPILISDKKTKSLLTLSQKDVEKIKVKESNYSLTIFSQDVKNILEYCDYMDYPFKLDINYIDISNNKNYITYLSIDRQKRLKPGENPFKTTLRNSMLVGKFLKKLNPYTDKVNLERKVNIYKAMWDTLISGQNTLKMVQGMDVIEWYQESKYFPGGGSLNKSCMRSHRDKLKLYNDPDRVALLILVNPLNQLLGRALVWNVSKPDITYMDRVYTVYPEHEERFYMLAEENGWTTYKNPNFSMIIKYSDHIGDEYENPYMDTFKFFVIKGTHGRYYLTNAISEEEEDNESNYILLEEIEDHPEDEYYDDDYYDD